MLSPRRPQSTPEDPENTKPTPEKLFSGAKLISEPSSTRSRRASGRACIKINGKLFRSLTRGHLSGTTAYAILSKQSTFWGLQKTAPPPCMHQKDSTSLSSAIQILDPLHNRCPNLHTWSRWVLQVSRVGFCELWLVHLVQESFMRFPRVSQQSPHRLCLIRNELIAGEKHKRNFRYRTTKACVVNNLTIN